jgi:polyhydroxyalkanoate synthesis regulator phasin
MDVERIQKINDLAVDLMKQGLATDRDAAIAQAEQILTGKSEYSEIRERMEPESKNTSTPEQPHLSQDEIKNILQQNSTFLVNQIKEFNNKITSLEQQIVGLKDELKRQSGPTIREMRAEVKPVKETEAPQETPLKAPAENHPRSGSYNDTDVSIEKFFYMGNK